MFHSHKNSPRNIRHLRQQSGFGLPMAIFVITVLALIVASMSSLQENSAMSRSLQVQGHRALFAAESGIEISLNLLLPPDGSPGQACATNPFFSHTFNTAGLRSCSVTTACSSVTVNGDDIFTLVSQGSCGSGFDAANRTLEVRAR